MGYRLSTESSDTMMTVPAGQPFLRKQWQPRSSCSLPRARNARTEKGCRNHGHGSSSHLVTCQKTTAALRRDRGFGQHSSSSNSGCFICGGPHLAKDCLTSQHLARALKSSCLQLNWISSLARKEKESRLASLGAEPRTPKCLGKMSGARSKFLMVMTSLPCSRARSKANHRENPPSMHVA